MNLDLAANIVGILGTALVVGAYVLMQVDKLNPKGLAFNIINLTGAIFLTLSLLVHFNLASLVIEIFWIAASIYGVVAYCRNKP